MPSSQHDTLEILLPATLEAAGAGFCDKRANDGRRRRRSIDRHTSATGTTSRRARRAPPPFWRRVDGAWRLRTVHDEILLPGWARLHQPGDQAAAFGGSIGGRPPTEAETTAPHRYA